LSKKSLLRDLKSLMDLEHFFLRIMELKHIDQMKLLSWSLIYLLKTKGLTQSQEMVDCFHS